jgi:hypothetical protein
MGRTPNTIELESLTVRYSPGVGHYLRNEMARLTKAKGSSIRSTTSSAK